MKAIRFIPGVAGVLGALLASTPLHAADTYQVTISPPAKVGDKYHYVATMTEKINSVINRPGKDPIQQNRNSVITLDGNVEVLKVDSKGSETKLQCTVNHLDKTVDGQKTEVLPPNSVLVMESTIVPATGKAGTQFVLQGGKLADDQIITIGNVIAAKIPEAPTDQEIFGTDAPQPIGGTWALNADRGVAFMGKMGVVVDPAAMSGKSELAGIEKFADTDCYHVAATMVASKFDVQMPPPMKVEDASINAKFSLLFPVTPSVVRKTSSITHVQMRVKGTSPQLGGEFTQENSVDSDQEIAVDTGK